MAGSSQAQPTRQRMVKLKVPPKFLNTLPSFLIKALNSMVDIEVNISPGVLGTTGASGAIKTNLGLKESSNSGLSINSVANGTYSLDKTSHCRKWVKKPATFKTFSGFRMRILSWKPRVERKKQEKKDKEKKIKAET